jgi:hypothetical protein
LLFQNVFEGAHPGFSEGAQVVDVVFHVAGAGGLPLGDRHLLEQVLFGAALGMLFGFEVGAKLLELFGVFGGQYGGASAEAVAEVLGPVDFCALRRLASVCSIEVIWLSHAKGMRAGVAGWRATVGNLGVIGLFRWRK